MSGINKASLPAREIEAAAEWMVRTILRCAVAKGVQDKSFPLVID
jgi:hypothetical protein